MVKNPPHNAGYPGHGTEIPHALEHLSPHAATTEPLYHSG